MSLIKCPDCDKLVSDKATSCPNCSYPFEKQSKQIPEVKIEGEREGCFLQTLNIGCLLTFYIIAAILLIAIWSIIFGLI